MNYIFFFFLGGGGGGCRRSEKKYVWRYDEIMIFFYILGSFVSIWGFLRSSYRFGQMFLGSLNSKYFWGMPDIPYILGVKSRCWAQA